MNYFEKILVNIGQFLNWLFPTEIEKKRRMLIKNIGHEIKKLRDNTNYQLNLITEEMLLRNEIITATINDTLIYGYLISIQNANTIYDIFYDEKMNIISILKYNIIANQNVTNGRTISITKDFHSEKVIPKANIPQLKAIGT